MPRSNASFAIAIRQLARYGRELVIGASLVCEKAGATLSLVNGSDESRVQAIRNAPVDGLILGHSADIDVLTSAARRRQLPFVILDSPAGPDVGWIGVDGKAGALAVVRHLVALGHRHFAILSIRRTAGSPIIHMPGRRERLVEEGFQYDHDRLEGFAAGLSEIGLEIRDVPVIETIPGEPSAGALVFDTAPQATAIMTMSDWQAITILAEASRRGIRVPEDVSVVGFDGTMEAARTTPPLTTLAHDVVEKGRLAAAMLLSGEPPRQVVLPTRLVVRGSTGPARN